MKNKILPISLIVVGIVGLIFVFGKNVVKVKNVAAPVEIKKDSSEIEIGVITDIHRCVPGNPKVEEFIKKVDKRGTDFNVDLGDNINFRLGNCSNSFREDWDWILTNLKTQSPLHFALGDHDLGLNDSWEFWKEKMGRDKAYYSFDKGEFHIVILDTVLGGEEMRLICEEDEVCQKHKMEYEFLRQTEKDVRNFTKYLKENNLTLEEFEKKKGEIKKVFSQEETYINKTRSAGQRDKGRLASVQLEWLRNELRNTLSNKIIIFSDHPLFDFTSERKSYRIEGLEELHRIFQESGKQIVAISGEAHLWHEEMRDGVQYYIVDAFYKPERNFAIFTWDEEGYRLEKISKNYQVAPAQQDPVVREK